MSTEDSGCRLRSVNVDGVEGLAGQGGIARAAFDAVLTQALSQLTHDGLPSVVAVEGVTKGTLPSGGAGEEHLEHGQMGLHQGVDDGADVHFRRYCAHRFQKVKGGVAGGLQLGLGGEGGEGRRRSGKRRIGRSRVHFGVAVVWRENPRDLGLVLLGGFLSR